MSNFSRNFSDKSPFKKKKELVSYDYEIDGKKFEVQGYDTRRGFKPSNKKGHNEEMKAHFGERPTKTWRIIERNNRRNNK